VFLLERQRKAVDDRPEDLEKLCYSIVSLGLIDKVEEDIVDRPPNESTEVEELAVDAVQGRSVMTPRWVVIYSNIS
jgi:hypothetical protein